MGILNRLSLIFRSEVNAALDRVEDTENMLNQAVLDMQDQLIKAKEQIVLATTHEKRLEKACQEYQELANQWSERAKLAVEKGSDDLAKVALERKIEYEDLAVDYKKQWEAQKEAVIKLKESFKELEKKFAEVKRNKDLLIARNRRAVAQENIYRAVSDMSKNKTFNIFKRLERKVEEQEAKAEALKEITEEDTKLERQFEQLKSSKDRIEEEYMKLKNEVTGKDIGTAITQKSAESV